MHRMKMDLQKCEEECSVRARVHACVVSISVCVSQTLFNRQFHSYSDRFAFQPVVAQSNVISLPQ
jgi:hypothetical protein